MTSQADIDRDTSPVMTRDPRASLPGDLPRGADIPDDLDPLADGVLMRHQADWIADPADIKICAKGRRTGITFAESFDATLIAAAKRSAGGQNYFYIGDTKDKGREFIGYISHFAKIVAKDLGEIEEFLFEDQAEDGTTRQIAAYRVRFASGFRVEALSSRPENIRGLQGVVCIDEAAFHRDVRSVLDAVTALLIWGGKIRIISSHNGMLNPFNEMIREAESGKLPASVHTVTFHDAVVNGLFRRVYLMKSKTWSPEVDEQEETKIRAAYGARRAAMRQELDAVPADAAGAALTRVQIEAAMEPSTVIRLHFDDDFKHLPAEYRKAYVTGLFRREVEPALRLLKPGDRHVFGFDFARSGDASVNWIMAVEQTTTRRSPLVVELRNCPFDQQREMLFMMVPMLPRFSGGKLDATGNGAYLAEVTAQKFGAHLIEEIKLSEEWYRTHAPRYVDAVAERSCRLAQDEDIVQDHQGLQYVGRIIKIPDDHRTKGSDGLDRHGDAAIAGMIAYAASEDMRIETKIETPSTMAEADGQQAPAGMYRDTRRALWG
ncbi:hypothetical protein [Pleomorphomonas carboxyditropha]|uniref:Mu-like prophage FluMu protein gp28 n=1 Tax=Pleomorphomonas carboxyditropha TaxID=2023338 RepID=A0A2G9WV88_9HYPH|nr:hypothetical protein [Pleomorphomonas carboxyditropha]PIO98593.1 hypothetical protein CJ014_14845 [Pleomorphomonas carboxyditropha]